jgi:hypothetical protein
MPALLELVRARRAELERARHETISDEKRIWALMALQAKAEEGDPCARAAMAAVRELFAAAGFQKS